MPDATNSPDFSVSIDGVSIGASSNCEIPLFKRPRILWKQTLSVEVKPKEGASILPNQAVVLREENDNLDFREKAPEVTASTMTLKVKPQRLGEACIRLRVINEPRGNNQNIVYPFRLESPFALSYRGEIMSNNPKIERPELMTILNLIKARYIADRKPVDQVSDEPARGIWLYGILGCGKSTLLAELRQRIQDDGILDEQDEAICQVKIVNIPFVDLLNARSSESDHITQGVRRKLDEQVDEQVEEKINKKIMDAVKDHFVTKYPEPLSMSTRSDGQLARLREWVLAPKLSLFLLFVLDEFDRFFACDQVRAQKALTYLTDVVSSVFGRVTNSITSPQSTAVLVVGDYIAAEERLKQQGGNSFWRSIGIKSFNEGQIDELMTKVFDSPIKAMGSHDLYMMTTGHPLLVNTALTLYMECEKKPGSSNRQVTDIVQSALRDEKSKVFLGEVMRWLVRQAPVRPGGGALLTDRLDPKERQHLMKLLRGLPCQGTSDETLKSLRAKGFLDSKHDRIRSQLLRDLLMEFSDLLK